MGADKALCVRDGRTFWERQWHLLEKLGLNDRFLVGPRRAAFPVEIECIDDAAAERGPLGGVTAALERARETRVLILAVDMPLVTAEDLAGLLEGAGEQGCVPFRELGGRRYYEPLAAIYPRKAASEARSRLAGLDWSLQGLVRTGVEAGWLREWRLSPAACERFHSFNLPTDLDSK